MPFKEIEEGQTHFDPIAESIARIKTEMVTQDNRSTSYPIFIVVENKKVYGVDSEFADGKERKERDYVDEDSLCESCQTLEENDEELLDDCDDCDSECFINYKVDEHVPNLRAGFFFTAKACDKHIELNRHHYNETARSYAISAYYNEELKDVMKFITR